MRTDNLWRGMGGLDDNDPDAHLFLPLSTQWQGAIGTPFAPSAL
jgi:hypothetical protein